MAGILTLLLVPLFGICVKHVYGYPDRLDSKRILQGKVYDPDYLLGTEEQQKQLVLSMNQFREQTSVVPEILVVDYDEWCQKQYGQKIQNYAQYQYNHRYQDQKHWLIVYSELTVDGQTRQYWGEARGNETTDWLTDRVVKKFMNDLRTNTDQYSNDKSQAVSASFQALTEYEGRKHLQMTYLFLSVFIGVAYSVGMIWLVLMPWYLNYLYEIARPIESLDTYDRGYCPRCKGEILIGYTKYCPHCGA